MTHEDLHQRTSWYMCTCKRDDPRYPRPLIAHHVAVLEGSVPSSSSTVYLWRLCSPCGGPRQKGGSTRSSAVTRTFFRKGFPARGRDAIDIAKFDVCGELGQVPRRRYSPAPPKTQARRSARQHDERGAPEMNGSKNGKTTRTR